MKVLAFGEILWDIIEGENHLGGAPFNFAAHSVQCGAQASIVSGLGTDKLGLAAIDKAKAIGVDISLIQLDQDHETGTVEVLLVNGQPDYLIKKNVAYDFIRYDPAKETLNDIDFDVFYFGTLAQRNAVSADTLKTILKTHKFSNVFFDVNLRKEGYTESVIQDSLQRCNILKLNTDEVAVISDLFFHENLGLEKFSRLISGHYPIKIIIITSADKGCFIFHDESFTAIEGKQIELSDAVGAGDAFSASFMFEFFKRGDAVNAAKIANQIGLFVASKKGPIPPYSDEIMEILITQE